MRTDRWGSVRQRLEGLPGGMGGEPLPSPAIRYENGEPVIDPALTSNVLGRIREMFRRDTARDISAALVEPIQCTAGDRYLDPRFFRELRALCSEFDVPLIFDEIQTGFGGTGTMWYFEQCGVVPDVVVFGKKAQTSGIMVKEQYGEIFAHPLRLEVTWDGDLMDMIRCRQILRAYARDDILANVSARGAQLASALREMPGVRNVRQTGLLIAFDFDRTEDRDAYVRAMRAQQVIVLSTQTNTVRWRPNLALSESEADTAIARSALALEGLAARAPG
jgi:L-lysine 6-transaminase